MFYYKHTLGGSIKKRSQICLCMLLVFVLIQKENWNQQVRLLKYLKSESAKKIAISASLAISQIVIYSLGSSPGFHNLCIPTECFVFLTDLASSVDI